MHFICSNARFKSVEYEDGFEKTGNLLKGNSFVEEVILPDSLKVMDRCFDGRYTLKKLNVPSNVEVIMNSFWFDYQEYIVGQQRDNENYNFDVIIPKSVKTISLVPNGLLVYIGPTLKASAGFTGPTSNVVTVTTVVNNVTYTFTFNANAIDNTAKTITIYYVAPETP